MTEDIQRAFVQEVERVGRDSDYFYVRREASLALGALAKVVPEELVLNPIVSRGWNSRPCSDTFSLGTAFRQTAMGLGLAGTPFSTVRPTSYSASSPVQSEANACTGNDTSPLKRPLWWSPLQCSRITGRGVVQLPQRSRWTACGACANVPWKGAG